MLGTYVDDRIKTLDSLWTMKKSKSIHNRKASPAVKICQERLACITDKAKAAVSCGDCGTLQCSACELELHKDGDTFFHERQPLLSRNETKEPVLSVRPTVAENISTETRQAEILDLNSPEAQQTKEKCSSGRSQGKASRYREQVGSSSSDSSEPLQYDSTTEYFSLDLDSFPDLEVTSTTSQEMKGSSKKSKKNKSSYGNAVSGVSKGDSSGQVSSSINPLSQTAEVEVEVDIDLGVDPLADHFSSPQHQPPSLDSIPSSENGDEDLITGLMQSMSENQLSQALNSGGGHQSNRPSALAGPTHNSEPTSKERNGRSFLWIDDSETLQIRDKEAFYAQLGCAADSKVKIVSIFGNTGDGKSYTMNQVFFGGEEVFATSADQDTCTVGVWAAYDPHTSVVCIDTEGLLGITTNHNRRTRLLLKVLAVSDVVIYRTCADRLHTDLFQFLSDASLSYTKHFKKELEAVTSRNGVSSDYRVQELGPCVIVFHETSRTNTLDSAPGNGNSKSSEVLRQRFAELGYDISAFSSIHYVGTKTERPPTDFKPLIRKVKDEIRNCTVRSPRSPELVLRMLSLLNTKFNGEIYSESPNSFPDEFFTCPSKCLACQCRCTLSMSHKADHVCVSDCRYIHVYDNRVYVCKKCYHKGNKNVVVPKTCASNDNSIMGAAKYAWSGYVLECRECGIIYRSRQHWYGNADPTQNEVQSEIQHIWPGQAAMPTGTHNAARKLLDGVQVLATTVGSYGSKPARLLSDWVADQVAPPYWIPNQQVIECHACKRTFCDQEKKHHCRACGQGFCDDCTQFTKPVPEKGWGPTPVRVCEHCYQNKNPQAMDGAKPGSLLTAGGEGSSAGETNSLLPRQMVENVQSVLGVVASVAIDYPIEMIKDSARPAYWIPDHLIKHCQVCKAEFNNKNKIHHCRACGAGVCAKCSSHKRTVASRGWDTAVRVCDTCNDKEGQL